MVYPQLWNVTEVEIKQARELITMIHNMGFLIYLRELHFKTSNVIFIFYIDTRH